MQKPIKFTRFPRGSVAGERTFLYGLPIYCGDLDACRKILKGALRERRGTPYLVFTPNLEMLSSAKHSPSAFSLLASADLLLPDGIGVRLLSRFAVKTRIAGIDTGEFLLSLAEKNGYRVYLLGGKEGVAKTAAERLTERFPALRIVGAHHGYFDSSEEPAVTAGIRSAAPDLLFVCMGFPRQEEFLARNRNALSPIRMALGLGGSLDVWAGNVHRAPLWMQKCGLEWLFRVLREPSRLRRILRSIRDTLLPAHEEREKGLS